MTSTNSTIADQAPTTWAEARGASGTVGAVQQPENAAAERVNGLPAARATAEDIERIRANLPVELLEQHRWVGWDGTRRPDGKLDKTPLNASTDGKAMSNASSTWASFEKAAHYAMQTERVGGVGIMLTGGPWIGIDLDHVIDAATRQLAPGARDLIEQLSPTYTEVSPSGDGLHLWLRGRLTAGWRKQIDGAFGPGTKLEVYSGTDARYFTVTGDVWKACPIADASDDDLEALGTFMAQRTAEPTKAAGNASPRSRAPNNAENDLSRARWLLLQGGVLDSVVDEYEGWLRVLAALRGLDDAGLTLAEEWSRRGKKYVEGDVAGRWPGLRGSSVASLFGMADDADPTWRSRWHDTQPPRTHLPKFDGYAENAADKPQAAGKQVADAVTPTAILATWRVEGPLVHQRTGIAGIDERTDGGLVFGSRVYLLGAPDAGKTALLVQIGDVFMADDVVVGYLAVDEDPGDVLQRFLQRRGWRRAACERRDELDLDKMHRDVAGLPLRLYSGDHSIESAAADLDAYAKSRGRRSALLVDSIQTVRSAGEDLEGSRYDQVSARTRAIRSVATGYRMLVVAASEMSRASYKSIAAHDRTSDLAAAKESGAIEYSARVMLALRTVPGESDLVEVRIAKNKHGASTREGEPGIFLRLDRAAQALREDRGYEAPSSGEASKARHVEKVTEDAGRIAVYLVEHPGDGTRDLDAAMSRLHCMGKTRVAVGRSLLKDTGALIKVDGVGNAKHFYIDGKQVPEDVLGSLPPESRPQVVASRPPELETASPCTPSDPECPRVPGTVPGTLAEVGAVCVPRSPIGGGDIHTHSASANGATPSTASGDTQPPSARSEADWKAADSTRRARQPALDTSPPKPGPRRKARRKKA